ncbi:MAG: hypothetical protein V3T28_05790 [Gemmatimonadales bacterium]
MNPRSPKEAVRERGGRANSNQGLLADVLATHPPMAVRVARLRRMAYQYEKTGVLPETV